MRWQRLEDLGRLVLGKLVVESRQSADATFGRVKTDTFFELEEDAQTGPYAIVKPSVAEVRRPIAMLLK